MFVESLALKLSLSFGLTSADVLAGDIKHLSLVVEAWGFEAELEWWSVAREQQSEDALFSSFLAPDLATAKLSIARTFDEVEESPTAMTVSGVVFERSVEERTVESVAGNPVLQRRYRMRFADRGRVLWSAHFPKSLYVDSTYKDVLDDNLPKGLTLSVDWPAATTKYPVLSLSLEEGSASFYDYVAWLLATKGGALYYDTAADSYKATATKPIVVTTEKIHREEVASLVTLFPRVRRTTVNVINAFTDAATKRQVITNSNSVTGVREDHLIRSSVASDLTKRVTLETARARQSDTGAHLELRAFPAVAYRPSMGVALDDDWSTNVVQSGKSYRVFRTQITANAVETNAGQNVGEASNRYELTYGLDVELASDPALRNPEFATPEWPLVVEGKVVSEQGTATEGTYQFYTDDQTSIDHYQVKIPLYDDKKVIAAYEPTMMSGHFYFPMVKDARVLVALDFDGARVVGFLDYRPGARLPLDSQGNHILVGKGKDDETSIRHVYEDAKPVLSIVRTKAEDIQTIKISEGTIFIETK